MAILGQSRAIATIAKSLRTGHVHHAWIFHGPFGVGKFTTARAFAALLLDAAVRDEHIDRFEPPAGSRVQELLEAGSHPDFHVIRKERAETSEIASLRDKKQTNIPIDLLRELMLGGEIDGRSFDGAIARTPYLGHGKVFVIDEAELMDGVGQNAILKTLEEPPPNTFIILVTTREDRLLPTIRSRCQRVGFVPLDPESMRRWVASSPLRDLDDSEREWILRAAEGSPGWASMVAAHGVHAWARELSKPLAELSRGKLTAGLSERMAELVGECAESMVKGNAKASKEAANRVALRMLFGVLGQNVRDGMNAAANAGDAALVERYARLADVLSDADEAIRRHLNLKHVLANLVAQWVDSSIVASSGRPGTVGAGA
jgi:DNA polymerase-3 subunit delta'